MGTNLDVGSSISLHAHPFHLHPHRSTSPSSSSVHHQPHAIIPGPEENPRGSSTSIESATRPEPNNQVSVSRHVSLTVPEEEEEQEDEEVDHSREEEHQLPHSPGGDIENQRPLRPNSENDPYQLASRLKTIQEVNELRPHPSSKRRRMLQPRLATRSGRQAKRIQAFYIAQNENISRLLKPVDEHRHDARVEHSGNRVHYKIAIHGSFIANVILAGLQVYAAASSGSLSLFTTMADAIFDPLSNLTLIISHRAVNRVDPRRFPSGKARIETAGNIVFCFIMCSLSFIIIVFSIKELAEGSHHEIKKFQLPAIIAVAIAFVTKFSLFLYCYALRNTYSQIRILWQDHRNDIVINGFGLMTHIGGSRLKWWIDPAGAIVLSVMVVMIWLRTAYKEFQLLVGVTANVELQQLITYVSMTHSPSILQIDTVRAYHSGPRIIVEVDIVMNSEESLKATHDVAEELQSKLESLPDVERAYVHVDYETSHKPEHFLKKEL
ncbi:MAG: hypothetical protein M1823_002182 [Watsoniomyces obsoletus]|nr:MAG: hypothetical protein M1823_002182 [Watsoniomyces obsoletus]